MKDFNIRNEIEIQKMNNFLECFSCKTEDELKQCFDKCGFWKTEEEMEEFYEKDSKTKNLLEKEKLLTCSLYDRNQKISGFYGEDLFSRLLFFNGINNDFQETRRNDYGEFDENLFLRKRFIIYGKKVKIQISENIRNDKRELIKIDKNKLDNFMKYGHYSMYDEILSFFDKTILQGINDKEYNEKLDKEINKIIDYKEIKNLKTLYKYLNYPPKRYSPPKLFTNVEKYMGKYDDKLFEKLKTIW